jgi:serine phosphatase RsbU (regulator of sigma subunit)
MKKGKELTIGVKSFSPGVGFIPYKDLIQTDEYKKSQAAVRSLSVVHKETTNHCLVFNIKGGSVLSILICGKTPFDSGTESIIRFIQAVGDLAADRHISSGTGDEKKYKTELINMRQIQAMLFPKFEDITGYDVGAVYLPSQLMSGNFVDAFPLNSDVYQIATCVVGGYDATSSFVGSAVRTLIRAQSGPSVIPSALIETINQKLARLVSGVHYLVNMTIFQFNLKNGRMSISSCGPVSTLFYISGKKNTVNLGDTQIGKDLAKRNVFKDISFKMDSGDSLLYYSDGVLNAEAENGESVFGAHNLYDKYRSGIDLASTDHVHTIAQSVFEYINYGPIRDDILLVKIKKL